eukprot:TRINITY_DN5631_c0_g1_i2.p1 TRINITY_DN5631_c0_g1~~TRINITY_DN5631_c0_g1_i2.p1  ORF type:complete len:230 (+),score=37.85 TRINITY_DN5631_c0_g1_i2:1-690(+)
MHNRRALFPNVKPPPLIPPALAKRPTSYCRPCCCTCMCASPPYFYPFHPPPSFPQHQYYPHPQYPFQPQFPESVHETFVTTSTVEEVLDPEGEEGEEEYVLSQEVVEMFAKTEVRRRERKRKRLEQLAEDERKIREQNQLNLGKVRSPAELTPLQRQALRDAVPAPSHNPIISSSSSSSAVVTSSPSPHLDIAQMPTQRLEAMMDSIFKRACDMKNPSLWPAEPLRHTG